MIIFYIGNRTKNIVNLKKKNRIAFKVQTLANVSIRENIKLFFKSINKTSLYIYINKRIKSILGHLSD